MGTLERANELAELLRDAGINAVTNPSAIDLPCVVINAPSRRYDLHCGYTATWELVAIANAPQDEDSWADLDILIDAVADILNITEVQQIGWGKEEPILPAALMRFEEIIND